jgi:hypothetical protein
MNAPENTGVVSSRRLAVKLAPEELRAQVRLYSDTTKNETDPSLKRAFASAAFALAQLGECIERFNASPPRVG